MSFKILYKCYKKVTTKEHICLLSESLSLQLKMYSAKYEVILINEFSFFLSKNIVFRGWEIEGEQAYISSSYQDLNFTETVAFSEHHFYGIMINERSNNRKI